jgi:hypothetical protein
VRLGRPPTLPTEIVQQIIENRTAGDSLRRIAARLTANGVPTAQGGAQWNASPVKAVLEGQAASKLMREMANA